MGEADGRTRKKTPVVFVHGGGHGKWCWDAVRAMLPAASIAVDLPGRGDRPFDARVVTLDDCVDAVLQDAAAAGYDRFILVGHSLGGLTITEVAQRHPERVAHLVYVDAAVFPKGVNLLSFMASILGHALEIDDFSARSTLQDRDFARQRFMRDLDDDGFEAAYAKLVPEPYGLWQVSVSGVPTEVPATYLRCLHQPPHGNEAKDFSLDLLRRSMRHLDVVMLEADHDVFLSQPWLMRDYLAAIARSVDERSQHGRDESDHNLS